MQATNGTNSTSIQEVRSVPIGGAARVRIAPAGIDALARSCRGLFGGAGRQQVRVRRPRLDETVEIVIPRQGIARLASAA